MTYSRAQILARIIIRVKLGVASLEEREILGVWLDASEDNRQLYKSIVRWESVGRRLRLEDELNRTTDFKRVHEHVAERLAPKSSKRKLSIWISVGGGVAAACLCGVVFMLYLSREVKVRVALEVKQELMVFETKKDKVMLVLESGEQIGLESHVPDSIKLSQAILIGETGMLSYEPNFDSIPQQEVRHRVYTTAGGDYSLVLSDGTKVWLNAETELEYPVQFVGRERVVKLSGEAYFEVKHDSERPFVVQTSDMSTRVLGTSFNVSAYADEKSVYTTLLSGKVEVCLNDDFKQGNIPVVLKPGMQSQWKRGSGGFVLREVNPEDVVAWRYGVFVFDEDDIEVVTRMLSRWYDVRFVFDGGRREHHTFSGKMSKDEKLESILKMLTMAGGPEFRVENNVVHIIEKR